MAVMYQNQQQRRVYYHMSTTNKSFLEMHYFLKDKGIKNNKFMLVLYDPDLASVDPYDKRLNTFMKQKILRECMVNPWYFFRYVVRVPDSGVATGSKFQLSRGNLALLFCLMLNLNIFLEMPRQLGKTISSLCWYLYCFNFGTANSEMVFLNKKLDDSKLNLQRIKEIRDLLPTYLQLDQTFGIDGKRVKAPNTVETLVHPINGNKIKTVASARSKVAAASLLRGRTIPQVYADEFAFIPYNNIIYTNMVPAFNTASRNAKANGKPYGMLITTTPGILTTDEGQVAFNFKNQATEFSELWYDLSFQTLMELIESNTNSSFVYVKYTYQQLGKDEQWFKKICVDMQKDWTSIRREVLLEWAQISDNSPFRKEDLDMVASLVKQPINSILLLSKYKFDIYEQINLKYPPLIGVDVSGGYSRDSSAITVVDSYSTKVCADMNCNYISTVDLSKVIYEIVTKYMPNAVVNVERNGGFGASVLSKLVTTSIKKNLYWEIQDRVLEERFNGTHINRKTQKVKIYGSDSTSAKRDLLMELLRERIEYHKDKVISPIILSELKTLEVKRSGRIEHSTNGHDDSIFSWLWALYIYYYGQNLMQSYGITKHEIRTDQDLEEAYVPLEEKYDDLSLDIEVLDDDMIQQQMKILNSAVGSKSFEEWMQSQNKLDEDAMKAILSTKVGQEAFARQFNVDKDEIQQDGMYSIPNSVFTDFYNDEDINEKPNKVSGMLDAINNLVNKGSR